MGARQVGKTYTLKMFGEREYENVAYISCGNNSLVKGVRLSMSDFRDQEWMENVPLYATETYFHYFVNPTE